MINCPSCRSELPDLSRFCSVCGHALGGVAVTDPPAPGGARPSEIERRLSQALAGRYRIGKLLGQGGMGAVFLADDLELDRQVAIKVLPSTGDQSFVERFRREARTAARLDHPNIIPIYGVESQGDLHYFVMRYVPGQSLEDLLADRPKLELEQARRILVEAAKALAHAHRQGIVHRDVKPANIMLEGGDRVILTDFGISKAVQATTNLTSTGTIIGTPTYMAPEQARGLPVDGRSDQYALAVVGYEMLTGAPPFESDDVFALIFKHLNDPAPPLGVTRPDLPPGLVTAIERALAKEPEQRFANLEEFVAALDPAAFPHAAPTMPLAAPVGSVARPPRARAPGRAPAGRSRRAWLGGAALVATAAAIALALANAARPRAGALAPPADSAAADPTSVTPPATSAATSLSNNTTRPAAPATVMGPDGNGPRVGADAVPTPPAETPPPQAERRRPVLDRLRNRPSSEPLLRDPAERPRLERARLTIGVEGSYATVYLDDELIGESPVVRMVGFGEHTIRLEREGYRTVRERIVVNGPTTRRFTLEPVRSP
ncbi:MAG: protein kinase [Gemmatimonadales bacterium]